MKQNKKDYLPLGILLLGAAAAAVRGMLYRVAVDDTGLLLREHGLWWLLWAICAGAVAAVLPVVKLKGSNRYEDNFGPGAAAAAGCFAMAVGIFLTVLEGNTMPRPGMVMVWKLSGALSLSTLAWAGREKLRGKQPFVLCYALPAVFLALHMVSRYQPWSGEPQTQDWLFSLLGLVGLLLCAYGNSAFSAGKGKRRSFLAVSLLTAFACLAALPHTESVWLYLGGALWAFTGRCRMEPVPVPEEAPKAE